MIYMICDIYDLYADFFQKRNMGKRKKNFLKTCYKRGCGFTHFAGGPRLSDAFELVLCLHFAKCASILEAYLGMRPYTTQLGLVCVFKEINR